MVAIEQLNQQQKQAVLTNAKYVRIIAGAGSGKTRVLVMRVIHLIEDLNITPSSILAITFTNKAANEMKERIFEHFQKPMDCTVSTIHALCVRILRRDIVALGFKRDFTIMDTSDQKSLLKEAYKKFQITDKDEKISAMLSFIANNKLEERSVEQVEKDYGVTPLKKDIYAYYLQRQKEMMALDFNDLILYTRRLLRDFPEIRKKWQQLFNYIHVDEFQDVDNIQYEIIRALVGPQNHLYVVGDPDQTIYTWRGANVDIIMHLMDDFDCVETIVLNRNYRSTTAILNGANSLIKNNKNRIDKDLYTENKSDEKITHITLYNESAEAAYVRNQIETCIENGKHYSDIAILYRTNAQSRLLEKQLVESRIPYIVYGGLRFYERAEIKDALAYLRLIVQGDDLSFRRVINVPKRGIGDKTIDTLLDYALQHQVTLFQAAKEYRIFSTRTQNAIDAFVVLIEMFKAKQNEMPMHQLLEEVLLQSGYTQMLLSAHDDERQQNLNELQNDLLAHQQAYEDSTLSEYLQLVSLYTDKESQAVTDCVSLMTVHASKGLEFNIVFVVGMSENIFPSARAINESRYAIEEERRIAYVAFTRAKEKLYLTDAQESDYQAGTRSTSRFVKEIDSEFIETPFEKENPVQSAVSLSYPSTKASPTRYKKGDRVEHATFGNGLVITTDGDYLTIAFNHPHGIKKLIANHPSIKKVKKTEAL